MFDFRLLVFHTVAKRLNFTKAAEALFITQPAVSKHVHEIEAHFKLKLFDRNGTRIKLTAAGQQLLQYTEELFTLYRNLDFEMNALAGRHTGKLVIGASTTVAQYVLPQILAQFHQKFSDISVALITNNTESIEYDLLHKNINIGIIEGHSKNPLIRYNEFIQDQLVLVTRCGNPLLNTARITVADLLSLPLLLRESGSGTLDVIVHALKPYGIKLSQLIIEMYLGSTESIKQYLLYSNCMAFLSIHSISKELKSKELQIVEVEQLNIQRYFYSIQQQGDTDPLSDLFMKFMMSTRL